LTIFSLIRVQQYVFIAPKSHGDTAMTSLIEHEYPQPQDGEIPRFSGLPTFFVSLLRHRPPTWISAW
jgi:hypothetical protein